MDRVYQKEPKDTHIDRIRNWGFVQVKNGHCDREPLTLGIAKDTKKSENPLSAIAKAKGKVSLRS
ncbi:hypothetical protein H5410_060745 [Solanum commersonii]|uniref:Uncharacterized protein n=1 Tax=Solanum commersonii TaxID=4109 RepID=A0A9J5W5W0_SOLCO|nr:hypothetical protein H5410_060745 [Solanum commersonii]